MKRNSFAKVFKISWTAFSLVSAGQVDRVKRPDHYKCLDCGERFNDAKFVKSQEEGIHSAIASCPNCSSSRIKISWWKKKER